MYFSVFTVYGFSVLQKTGAMDHFGKMSDADTTKTYDGNLNYMSDSELIIFLVYGFILRQRTIVIAHFGKWVLPTRC